MAAFLALLVALAASGVSFNGSGPPGGPVANDGTSGGPSAAATDFNGSGPPGRDGSTDSTSGNGPPG